MMVTIANELAASGLGVDLIVANAHGPNASSVDANVRLIDLTASGVMRALPALVRYLRGARPTALLATLTYANVVAVVARRLAAVPTRVFVRQATTPSEVELSILDLKSFVAQRALTWAYSRAAGVIAVSTGVAEDLVERFGLPPALVHTVPNPVVDSRIALLAREPLDDPWFTPGSVPSLLAVGRLGPEKDFSTLIEAFALLRGRRPARLTILGDGDERSRLEHLVAKLDLTDDVKLPGFDPNPYRYMARANMLVLSSVREGLPGVLIQAMSCGTPVVATDCRSGPAEILDGGRYGELVPVRNPHELAAAMERTLDREPDRELLRERSMLYSVERSVSAYRELLLAN